MSKLFSVILLLAALTAGAAEQETNRPLVLKDGSYLFINDDDNMRMVDKNGNPIQMKDGVEMELEDGTVIMMKNKKIWRHLHRDFKN